MHAHMYIDLFGTEKDRLFPPLDGAHVHCAAKSANSNDPFMGCQSLAGSSALLSFSTCIAIAKNHEQDAYLFVEDAGFFADEFMYMYMKAFDEQKVIKKLDKKTLQVIRSQLLCSKNQTSHLGRSL